MPCNKGLFTGQQQNHNKTTKPSEQCTSINVSDLQTADLTAVVVSVFRTQAEMGHTCRGTINLATANIAVEDSCNFVISNGGAQTYHLKASSEVERQRWITALELAKAKAVQMQAESGKRDSYQRTMQGKAALSRGKHRESLQSTQKQTLSPNFIVLPNDTLCFLPQMTRVMISLQSRQTQDRVENAVTQKSSLHYAHLTAKWRILPPAMISLSSMGLLSKGSTY